MKENIDPCVKCSICNLYCPVALETDLFPGAKTSGPDAQRFKFSNGVIPEEFSRYCIGCGNCVINCPAGINTPLLNILSKAKYREKHPLSLGERLLENVIFLPSYIDIFSNLINKITNSSFVKKIIFPFLGLSSKRELPYFAKRSFSHLIKAKKLKKGGKKVVYFYGCYTEAHEPEVGEAVVYVLNKNGYDPVFPSWVCCGAPFIGAGNIEKGEKLAKKNIKSLSKMDSLDIIFSSTTCYHTIRDSYKELYEIDGIDDVAKRCKDIFQFLVELNDNGKLNKDFGRIKKRYFYHTPCHLKLLGIGTPALEILKLIPSIEIIKGDALCCGLGGLFGYKDYGYDISVKIGEELAKEIEDSNVDGVISDCEGCRIQVHHLTKKPVYHPITILMEAYKLGDHLSKEI